jgi:hypothetical protein
MSAYWAQWDHSEIMSMYGIEENECNNEDENCMQLFLNDVDIKKGVRPPSYPQRNEPENKRKLYAVSCIEKY